MAHTLQLGSVMDRRDLPIATPCGNDWRKMTPVEGGRFCGDCKKVVRDLSSMSEKNARALLRAPGTSELCVRYLYDQHGRIFFGGDPAPTLLSASLLHRAKRAAVIAAAAAAPAAMVGCSGESGLPSYEADRAQLHAPKHPSDPSNPANPANPSDPSTYSVSMGGAPADPSMYWTDDASVDGGNDGGADAGPSADASAD